MSMRIGVSLPVQRPIPMWIGAAVLPAEIGSESGIHGRSEEEWLGILRARKSAGASHLCMRTLGGELDARGHLDALTRVHRIPVEEGQFEDLE